MALMLTFDDGLVSFAREAMPRLTRFGFAATLFVVAGRLGGHADWPGRQTMAPVERLLDRPALVEIASAGVEIGAHAVTHQRLSSLLPDVAAREVLDSRARLEDALGRPVRSFAYPYGDAPIGIARLVREQFAAGFGIRLAWASPASRLETIERIDAYYLRKRASLALLDGWPSRAVLSARSGLRALRRASGYGS
jgi:peptidoglycan/xylan/chitin deacetylase (PgdA/CDA1 family)